MKNCRWEYQDEFEGYWETACGHQFMTTDGCTLEEHKFKFCPFCGKEIRENRECGTQKG